MPNNCKFSLILWEKGTTSIIHSTLIKASDRIEGKSVKLLWSGDDGKKKWHTAKIIKMSSKFN